MAEQPAWQEIDKLISEQKMQEALQRVIAIRDAARQAGDQENWTRALIRQAQLETALSGFETAVRTLKDQPWPDQPLYRSILNLFYGQSLVFYLQAYSWEIAQRERVETSGAVDLKAWTQEQIFAAAQAAYLEVWKDRGAWGEQSIGTLAEYIEQNDYPPRIRGTLRDAVSYLWVELLANTNLWRPEQSNDVFRLDLESLLGPRPLAEEAGLAAPEVHPLTKIAAILADLEAWHQGRRQPEAAFEARLERLRRLANSFTQKEDRKRLEADLEAKSKALGRSYAWWSVGQAQLAEWVREEDRPNALVEARRIALAGAEAFPGSVGGKRCDAIVAQIEAPLYELTAMATDGPAHRSLQVRHQNLARLYFRAYRLGLEQTIETGQDYNLLPAYREVPAIVSGKRPDREWVVELPPTPDYRTHVTYVTPPFTEPGLWVVVASARQDFVRAGNALSALNMIVSDLVLVSRQHGQSHEVTVRSGATGEPVAGAAVTLYAFDWQSRHHAVETKTTAADGRVSFGAGVQRDRAYFLFAAKGADETADLTSVGFNRPYEPDDGSDALIYTDRSVYRPEQEVLWKVVAYGSRSNHKRFEVEPRKRLEVQLTDANGEVVATAEVTTNAHGSASGRFRIPSGRLLGGWSVGTAEGGAAAMIQVEEYKRPTFEATIDDPAAPLRINRPATLEGSVRYYFGLPVTAGEVAWRVTRAPQYPPWWWWWGRPAEPPQVIATGRETLDADGKFRLTFTPEADERQASTLGLSYAYRLDVDVTDEGGETRSAERTFRVGFVAVQATISSAAGFVRAGQTAVLTVQRTNLDGAPQPGAGAWRLMALAQPPAAQLPADQPLPPEPATGDTEGEAPYRTPGDRLRPRWDSGLPASTVLSLWPDGAEAKRGSMEHGASGEAKIELGGLAPGAYRLRYETTDAFGARFEASHELVVARQGATPLAVPVIVAAEATSVPVGGMARFLLHSGLSDQALALEVFRGAERLERREMASGSGAQVLEIQVTERDRGSLTVSLTGLRDHQLLAAQQTVLVPWDERELEVEFATFRDRMKPGAKETWRVTVKGHDQKALAAGAAEVLAYMYDRSLDFFAPHLPADPLDLYPGPVAPFDVRSNLGGTSIVWREGDGLARHLEYPSLTPDRLKFFDGYGIGGPGMRRMRMPGGVMAGVAQPMAVEESVALDSAAPAEVPAPAKIATGALVAQGIPGATPPPPPPPPPPAAELRSDFSETAFWYPHLLTGEDGSVAFEFTVPDSVTEWNVWVHALTKDFRAGSLTKRTASVKDLMVRPYLPRFLREGDEAAIKVVVNNAGEAPLSGRLNFEILDPETDRSLLAEFGLPEAQARGVSFSVEPGKGTSLTFPIKAPSRVGQVALKVVARAGDLSDGEQRPVPLLPGRYHLAQSRFVTLKDRASKTLRFEDMTAQGAAGGDPTRIDEQLVVTLDAQLFYGVLSALPYLVDYPYECSEQTLNRFVSTGIVSSLLDRYPSVARMAKEMSQRETQYESFAGADPNRKMALEETPWLVEAKGGGTEAEHLINVLDPRIARAQRESSLAKLRQSQTSLGGFPWWPGGPPSPYMTLYILQGMARAREFGIEVPQDMTVAAWGYLHRHYVEEIARELVKDDCCWELVTFLSWVLSSYPDEEWTGGVFSADERRRMLDFSFRHWKQHSPLLKGYLALALKRAGRAADAELVFDSVMDSAKTSDELGTYWAPEDRAWLWYNDTIEGHSFALRTLTELEPADARRHGLVQWLLLNKKLNHWKSTRATAEVIYALVHYLEHEGTLAVREEAKVTIGDRVQSFVFEPDRYTGKKNQIVVPGPEIEPASMSAITVEKQTPGFLFASATWHFSTEQLPPEERGDFFVVSRRIFKRVQTGKEWVLQPLAEGAKLEVGDQVEVQLSIRAKHAAEYVHLRDPRGAGFEPETTTSGYKWDYGVGWYEEVRDSGTNFFFDWLPAGEYTFKYRLRANLAGAFKVGPATLQSMYAPEFNAYSAGAKLAIEGE